MNQFTNTDREEDKTYQRTLMGEIETALTPFEAFKEILLDSDDDGLVKRSDIGVVVEALTTFARRRLFEVDANIRRDVGRIDLSLAMSRHPHAEIDTVLSATVEGVRHA